MVGDEEVWGLRLQVFFQVWQCKERGESQLRGKVGKKERSASFVWVGGCFMFIGRGEEISRRSQGEEVARCTPPLQASVSSLKIIRVWIRAL